MSWLWRVFLWATLLALPAWWASVGYQRWLAIALRAIVGWSEAVPPLTLEVAAPGDLALYVALCLASSRVPWGARLRAALLGVPLLMILELATLTAVTFALLADRAGAGSAQLVRACLFLVDAIPWLNVLVVWALLLGPREWASFTIARHHSRGSVAAPR